jgi:predicted CopG family antitoxin
MQKVYMFVAHRDKTMKKCNRRVISVDTDAYNKLNAARQELKKQGIEGASFSDAIRTLHQKAQETRK